MLLDKLGECVVGLMSLVCLLFFCVFVCNNKVEFLLFVLMFGVKYRFYGYFRMCIV